MQATIEEILNHNGFQHYETSAFAKPGLRCRHNLNYWQFGDYLGIGAGAHGKLSFPDHVTRHARARQPNEYMKADARTEESVVPVADLPFEFMLNALRLVGGFDVTLFSDRTGLPIHLIQSRLEAAEKKGLVERDWKRIRPTERGRRFLNDLLEAFLPDRPAPAPASG
jgi:oxygen-independent coproporphyrinogen-3 oxidase